jgi:16S rRNA (adenine1518-N6/adenine1519-N6)-dimethyltransferase
MNRLAIFCGYYSEPKILFSVPAGAFSPPPKVQSCVVRFDIRPSLALDGRQESIFFKLAALGFSEKRRQLKNTLRSMLGDSTVTLLTAADISPEARPEEVPLEKWITLAQKM